MQFQKGRESAPQTDLLMSEFILVILEALKRGDLVPRKGSGVAKLIRSHQRSLAAIYRSEEGTPALTSHNSGKPRLS